MCINPREFRGVQISCRQCWQCKEARVDSIVGRCVAESLTTPQTYCVTMTYGGDDRLSGVVNLHARILDYGDVSRYLKRLRKDHQVRYVAAGEYGDRKSRGHWHLILFCPYELPVKLFDSYYQDKYWHHGFSYWEPAIYEKMRYACAYVLKNTGSTHNAERRFGMSRHPPLGREYFKQLAMKHVEQGLSPQDLLYSFPDIRTRNHKLKRFLLTRRSAEFYKRDFVNAWALARGNLDWPQSDMIDEYLDAECSRLHCLPGDWLEKRRWYMRKLEKEALWRKGDMTGIGLRATRLERSESPEALDDRLRIMGNRKGIGYLPNSNETSVEPSSIPSISPSSRLHWMVEDHLTRTSARSG